MTGSVFIIYPGGWACSNEVKFDVEKDIITGENGDRVSKQTNTLKIKGLFIGKGEIDKNIFVDCVFKLDEKNNLQGFTGQVSGLTKDLAIITLLTKTERTEEILKKIKEDN